MFETTGLDEAVCILDQPHRATGRSCGQAAMAKKKVGAGDFADRGLTRVLADALKGGSAEAVFQKVENMSPLKLSSAPTKILKRVSQIYEMRGFFACSSEELSRVDRDGWTLSWIDQCDAHDRWHSASFCVNTSAGVWRVTVTSGGAISAAFPIVDSGLDSRHSKAQAGEGEGTVKEWSPAQQRKEESRLKKLGQSLQGLQQEMQGFIKSGCSHSKQARMVEACAAVQEQCWQDLPLLHASLEWHWGESWKDWAQRGSKQVQSACAVEECILPVQGISFTHSSISTRFLHGTAAGKDVETLVEDLRRGRVDPMSHPDLVIDAVRYGGRVHSLNNRRLWALQQHELLLLHELEVKACVRILPWTQESTVKRFLRAFTSFSDGETVACRTQQAGAPPDSVVATTLGRAVMATPASVAAERQKQGATQKTAETEAHEGQEQPEVGALRLGQEIFKHWRDAKGHVQDILRQHSSGKPLPEKEFRLMLDVFEYHPEPRQKRISEVTRVTVGSSEKFANTPSFWIWRSDGSGEDISVKKCWDKLDFLEKAAKKRDLQRETLAGGRHFRGRLHSWIKEQGKNYGFLKIDEGYVDEKVKIRSGQRLYLEWSDVAPATQARVNANRSDAMPFDMDQSFSFLVYRWLDNQKLGCKDARLL